MNGRSRQFARRRTPMARLALAALACIHLCVGSTKAQQPPITYDRLTSQVGISANLGEKAPLDLNFVDADNRAVRLADRFGNRPVILHLVYYQCPMLCRLSSDGLLRALDTLALKPGEDFLVVTLSFDPREGPELSARARQIAIDRFGAEAVNSGWSFLTGDQASIDQLCNAVGFRYVYDEKMGQFAHATGVFVLGADGTISRFLSGVEFSPRDLRLAIVDASAGKVGTASDRVLLMCYMYDPTTGRYGFAIMTALRAAGIATVGIMATGILLMLRRERLAAAHVDHPPLDELPN